MKVTVNRTVWRDLYLDNVDSMEIARACFYLGYGPLDTSRLISLGLKHSDVLRVLELAVDCGLRPDDYIIEIGP